MLSSEGPAPHSACTALTGLFIYEVQLISMKEDGLKYLSVSDILRCLVFASNNLGTEKI